MIPVTLPGDISSLKHEYNKREQAHRIKWANILSRHELS